MFDITEPCDTKGTATAARGVGTPLVHPLCAYHPAASPVPTFLLPEMRFHAKLSLRKLSRVFTPLPPCRYRRAFLGITTHQRVHRGGGRAGTLPPLPVQTRARSTKSRKSGITVVSGVTRGKKRRSDKKGKPRLQRSICTEFR